MSSTRYAVIRANLNVHGDRDWLIGFDEQNGKRMTTICGGKPRAMVFGSSHYAHCARQDARKLVPTFIDGRPIDWRVVIYEPAAPDYIAPIDVTRG